MHALLFVSMNCNKLVGCLEIAVHFGIKTQEMSYRDSFLTCILQWATYRKKPTCPKCKHPFESLNVHGSLDGRIYDYMFEESVCLLLRTTSFKPSFVEEHEEVYDDLEDYIIFDTYLENSYYYRLYEDAHDEDEDDEEDEVYYTSSPSLHIGSRRWGDNGYIRSGCQEAWPVQDPMSRTLVPGPRKRLKKVQWGDGQSEHLNMKLMIR
ncbi:hypothetical protein CRYUN_Cryun11dG0086600 [Craigia yunnanensis]